MKSNSSTPKAAAGRGDKFRVASERKGFTIIYNDFLDSQLLDCYEKMVFIAIKRFANNETLVAFPSLNRLHQLTGISKSKIQTVLASLEKKGVLEIEHRMNAEKGHRSNVYTLYDFADTWADIKEEEENREDSDQGETQRMIEKLEAMGYTVTKTVGADEAESSDPEPEEITPEVDKEKEPVSTTPTKAQDPDPEEKQLMQFDITNTIPNVEKCQAPEDLEEKYSLEQIQQHYDYDVLVHDNPEIRQGIDSVIGILHDALNTSKTTIRIDGEDKPRMIVVGRLLKLNHMDIRYAIKKYGEQTDRINNPRAYMLTILYHAAEQGYLDVTNQVTHDMAQEDNV